MGQLERDADLPAVVTYLSGTNKPVMRFWYSRGEKHRIDGPAFERINPDTGIVVSEAWYRSGELHRDGDLPARIFRCEDSGGILEETFAQHGLITRETGPAVIKYDPVTGRIARRQHWREGRQIPTVLHKSTP